VDCEFAPISRWQPDGLLRLAAAPRKAARSAMHAPVAVRFLRGDELDHRLGGNASWWTFDRRRHGPPVAIAFASPEAYRGLAGRWRTLANAIWAVGRQDPTLEFHDVAIDLGDGLGLDAPGHVHAFARVPGSAARLIPNPYLLRPRPWLTPPLPWSWKRDVLYFRGSGTGPQDLETNVRVAVCRVAKTVPRSDCRVSRIRQCDPAFAAGLLAEGLVGRRHPLDALNLFRFLVDVDGHTSSWDRFMLIGTVGGVPLRFEPGWEECWHDRIVPGEHAIEVDRHSLPAALERLRSRPDEARRVARAARRLVQEELAIPVLRQALATALRSAPRR
jgi:hypothetical protein